jgi:hypothetical protein
MNSSSNRTPPEKTPLNACLDDAQGALAYSYRAEMQCVTQGLLATSTQEGYLEWLEAAAQRVERFVEVSDWIERQRTTASPQSAQS